MASPTPGRAHVALELTGENWRYLESLSAETRRIYATALFEELRFLRTWNLTPSQQRAFAEDAARRGLTPWRQRKTLIKAYAMSLPDSGRTPSPAPALLPPHRTSFHVPRPHFEWIQSICQEEDLSITAGINHILEFGRTYGLPADLLAVLSEAARAAGSSPRDLLQVHLWRVAKALPVSTKTHNAR